MKKHFIRILTALLATAMLLPVTAQAAPADGWTDEVEQAYQTVTQLVIQRVTESKDYLATATQEENAKVVYALWTSGATVPGDFYDEYLQALADWLDLAVKRGKTAYIPGAIRTVAAMGLDVTDFTGHDLMDALRKPELVEADEDRLDMLMDLDAAGDAGRTDEFNFLREQLLTEALARQQSSGELRCTKWPRTVNNTMQHYGIIDDPDRFEFILITAKSVQALAPYQDRKDVSTAIDKALNYLSEQQLPSGGFVKYGEEDVEEDAAVLEMLAALGISLTDERFTKDDHTVLDGMMGWYQDTYLEEAENEPRQGFYRYNRTIYNEQKQLWMRIRYSDEHEANIANHRQYKNAEAYCGLSSLRADAFLDKLDYPAVRLPKASDMKNVTIDYDALINKQRVDAEERLDSNWYGDENTTVVSSESISSVAEEILALEKMQGALSSRQKESLQELMGNLTQASSEYLLGRKSAAFSPGAVRALQAIGADPGDFNGLDFLAPLTNLSEKDQLDYAEGLEDFDSVDESVWRSRGIDTDAMVDKYAAAIIEYQMPNGKFSMNRSASVADYSEKVAFTAQNIKALGAHQDKEYVAESVELALEYLSSVQLPDGSFPGMTGQPNGEATYAVLNMMNTLGISLDDERFVKNGNTVADGLRTFYIDGIGFVNNPEVGHSAEAMATEYSSNLGLGGGTSSQSRVISALTYLQAAENGKFGPDGTGNSVFEIVGSALTETPLGAILLAVIIVALLAFGMIRRYRRIKKEQ